MQHRRLGITEQIRRAWYRMQGEQPLVITFWPQDYPRGADYQRGGRRYQITRYLHAADYRFFEVWGRAVATPDQKRVWHGRVRLADLVRG